MKEVVKECLTSSYEKEVAIFFFFFGTTVLHSVLNFTFQSRSEITFLKNTVISKTIFGDVKHSHNKTGIKDYVEKFVSSIEI